jgi:hypothetical protein
MQVAAALSVSSKAANEDAWGVRTDGAWVIDGATPLGPTPLVEGRSTAAWLSATASDVLRGVDWAGRDLRAVLAEVIGLIAERGQAHGLRRDARFPTAAISLVRRRADRLEVCSLGDCTVLVHPPDAKTVQVTDPRFDGAEEAVLAEVRARLAEGVAPADAYRAVGAELRRQRAQRNTPAGLWVLAAEPAAGAHAALTSVPAPPGTDIVLMSDGFGRVRAPFGLVADEAELIRRIVDGGADALLGALRAAERADPDCRRYPRFGVHDDATVVWARV